MRVEEAGSTPVARKHASWASAQLGLCGECRSHHPTRIRIQCHSACSLYTLGQLCGRCSRITPWVDRGYHLSNDQVLTWAHFPKSMVH